MRLLNCSPELVIWGEHNGFLSGLATSYNKITSHFARSRIESVRKHVPEILGAHPFLTDQKWSIEWINDFNTDDIKRLFKRLLLDIFAHSIEEGQRWGFKEIQYSVKEVKFLQTLFPESRFLFLIRDPLSVLDSKVESFENGAPTPERLAQFVRQGASLLEQCVRLKEAGEQRFMVVHYEDLLDACDATLKSIEDFLHISAIDREKVRAIRKERTPAQRQPSPEFIGKIQALPDFDRLQKACESFGKCFGHSLPAADLAANDPP